VNQVLSFPVAVVWAAVLVAAIIDAWKFKIHNALTLPLLVAGLFYHAVVGGPAGLVGSFLGALLGFGLLLAPYLMGGLGGGDVKLLAAVGAWLGIPFTLCIFIAASLAAGVYALLIVVLCGSVRETWANVRALWRWRPVRYRHRPADDGLKAEVSRANRYRIIPFGAMIALGFLSVLGWYRLGGPS
jgi:prepilin peptidase CpaA